MMDFIGRMTSLTDIDGSVFAYEFDGEGNRLSQSLNDCLSKRFVYDGADVLLELNPTNGVAYAWVNGPGIDQPIERLLFIDGSPRARRTSLAFRSGTNSLLSIAYAYDDGDRRTNETWSTGRAMAYGYDDAHQLTSVAASRPSDAARYRYDAAGNPVDRAELGLDVTNTFNNLNQIVTDRALPLRL